MTDEHLPAGTGPGRDSLPIEEDTASGLGASLRARAEDEARRRAALATPTLDALSREAAEQVLHELQVHQIELEMQNAELRGAQEALAASRERYFRLYDLAPVGYLTLDCDGLIVEANLAAAAIVGVERAALLKLPWTKFIHAADQDRYYLQRRGALGQSTGFACELRQTGVSLQPRWVRMDVKPVPGASLGDMACWATLTDITESRRLADELDHAQKMKAIGTLASGVAHEFNNMLAVIVAHAELLAEVLPPQTSAASDVSAISAAAGRARTIARQLLAYGRKQELRPVAVDLRAAAPVLARSLATLLRPDTALRFELASDVGAPLVDPVQLEQVLVNLAGNARDAMGSEGELVIRADNLEVRAADAARGAPLPPGEYVRLRVTDNGTGIPADTVARLFEPFFTTKAFGQGTGLGLAIVHGIVTQSGGHIAVESAPGRGTTFTILLPKGAEPAPALALVASPIAPVAARFTGRLLLVDDEPLVRGVLRRLFSRLGFEVDEAPSGQEALERFTADPGRYRLVATDVTMPGMDGPTLAKRLAERRPGVKVLFMTGYLSTAEGQGGALVEGQRLLNKPFSLAELAEAVAELLPSDR